MELDTRMKTYWYDVLPMFYCRRPAWHKQEFPTKKWGLKAFTRTKLWVTISGENPYKRNNAA